MDVAELNIMSKGATVMLIVLGLAPWITALVVAVIHPILSQCFQKKKKKKKKPPDRWRHAGHPTPSRDAQRDSHRFCKLRYRQTRPANQP
jgi:hypothetical protein